MKRFAKGTWPDLKVTGGFLEAGTKEQGDVESEQRMDESNLRHFWLHRRRVTCDNGWA